MLVQGGQGQRLLTTLMDVKWLHFMVGSAGCDEVGLYFMRLIMANELVMMADGFWFINDEHLVDKQL